MTVRKHTLEPAQIDAIEGRLAGALRRVRPPSGVVQRLREHLHVPQRSTIVVRLKEWRTLGLAVGGVLSGTVLVMTFARALYRLFWRRSG